MPQICLDSALPPIATALHDAKTDHLPESVQPNAWYAPGFAPVSEFHRMRAILRGQGGLLEQTFLYLDLASAADWLSICSQQDYAGTQRVIPLPHAAQRIRRLAAQRGLDIIALGPGDGRLETRLLTFIAEQLAHPAIRFYLLDVSQPLLAEAYRHAARTLSPFAGISPVAIQGDFFSLPQYGQILYSEPSAPRLQVVVMLGGTFGNLENELRFVRDSLCGFGPGTLLLLDYPLCFAPADRPDEVRARDPWLAQAGRPTSWRDRVMAFWSGPLRRYVPGCQGVDIRMELNPATCPVPGSYAVEARAHVHVDGAADREFSVFRLKRHDPQGLARALKDIGWDPLDGWPYGADVGYPRALSLFARR